MHGLQACLFKYITVAAFRVFLSVVKMQLKGEVVCHVDIRKSWNCVFEFLWEPCIAVVKLVAIFESVYWTIPIMV